MRWRTILPLAITLLLAGAAAGQAQGRPVSAVGRQNLNFGPVLPGTRTTVSRLDAVNAGQFEVRGQRLTEVEIQLTLPAVMTSLLGATLPLEFGPADGGISSTPSVGASQAFDPRVPVRWVLPNAGRAWVFLGGSAVPAPGQAGGTYTASVVLTVAYTGN
ncbi:MAG TPA: hypothetical protein VFH97_09690 [Gemmatimonadales bacterium]|nr:hypothetical protein [Gemmatimonadales bacterium]